MAAFVFHILFLLLLALAADRDPYKILKVSKKASSRQIKKAYREQSKQWHPDKNKEDPDANKKFQDIAWAYEILGNETKRQIFDKHGEEGVKRSEQGLPPEPRGPFGGTGFGGFQFGGPGGGKFYFSGGDPFGGPGGFPFGFGGPRPGGATPKDRIVPVDWFEDSNIELVPSKPGGKIDVEDMNPYWPDVFFFFSSDNELTELAAGALIIVAEQLRTFIEFQAVDCRRAAVICRELRKSNSIYELQLLTKDDILEKPSMAKKVSPKRSRPFLDASAHLGSVEIMEWVMKSVPKYYERISSRNQMTKYFEDQASESKPLVVFVPETEEIDSRFQKLAAENAKRLNFCTIENSRRNPDFRQSFLQLMAPLMPHEKLRPPFMIHIADPNLIRNDTIEFLDFRESDFTVDLSLMKWVSMRRGNQGVYAVAARSIRELTKGTTQASGICGLGDSKYCFIYATKGGTLLPEEIEILEKAVKQHDSDAIRLLWVDSSVQRKFVEAFGVSPDSKKASLIVYRPKRKKYITFHPTIGQHFRLEEVRGIVESIIDGSLLLHEGIKINNVPILK
eukprot:Blabericola_migrator_1__2364@NODE_1661_length_4065_cov_57_966733_g1079_i0_p1_GENE_NODE_1661_length_4065_cov_57_966733_g1079_i0NODE_1661_length_4065_cov_57_966733_g1079_i0_p1_ORF_typecomplete_len563_score135_69DnaJ/PF00226_31/2_3e23DnaJ/PF00226_31/5_8e03DnaJ/PF00226_31/1_4e04Thioredoxin_6/PF13848_6/2_9e03Thioredoxin_6/PF13848_6/0_04Thioredoxin_6/PF13848_6/0_086preATPgrasp_3/PF18301_1/0_4Pmevalo_kinase/PF04275_14/8_9Pmevalo_kinase/PF04275_14/65_NODE_1661_length_4065_cov_57_966733_g1079_i023063994